MRRLILAVLVISVVLLGACVEPASAPPASNSTTTPEIEPTPEPEPEESPVNMPFVAGTLRDLHHAMPNLLTKYPIVTISRPWEEYLVHEFTFGRGGNWVMISRVLAVNVSEAKTHIDNAYCLTNKSKLPDEIRERDVSTDEITLEVDQAIILLEQQVSYSYSWQESDIEWARESTNPEINRESTFLDIIESYDEYREELSKVITKLELVLSKLPKDNVIFSLQ